MIYDTAKEITEHEQPLNFLYLWLMRHHPIIRMRKIGLIIMAVVTLLFTGYFMNGAWPCNTGFWLVNVYLPTGIGRPLPPICGAQHW